MCLFRQYNNSAALNAGNGVFLDFNEDPARGCNYSSHMQRGERRQEPEGGGKGETPRSPTLRLMPEGEEERKKQTEQNRNKQNRKGSKAKQGGSNTRN